MKGERGSLESTQEKERGRLEREKSKGNTARERGWEGSGGSGDGGDGGGRVRIKRIEI